MASVQAILSERESKPPLKTRFEPTSTFRLRACEKGPNFSDPLSPKESVWEAKVAPKTAPPIFVAKWHGDMRYAETATQQ